MNLEHIIAAAACAMIGAAIALGYAQNFIDETSPDEALSAHIFGHMCVVSTDVEDERESCYLLCSLAMRNKTMLAECEQGIDIRVAMEHAASVAGAPE